MTSFTFCSTPARRSMKYGGQSFPQRWTGPRHRSRETLAIAEQLGQPRPKQETPTEPAVRFESASYESVPVERELGSIVGLHLRRSYAALPTKLDRSTALATTGAYGEAGPHAAPPFRGHSQLLQDQNPHGSGRSNKCEYQGTATAWTWLPGS